MRARSLGHDPQVGVAIKSTLSVRPEINHRFSLVHINEIDARDKLASYWRGNCLSILERSAFWLGYSMNLVGDASRW